MPVCSELPCFKIGSLISKSTRLSPRWTRMIGHLLSAVVTWSIPVDIGGLSAWLIPVHSVVWVLQHTNSSEIISLFYREPCACFPHHFALFSKLFLQVACIGIVWPLLSLLVMSNNSNSWATHHPLQPPPSLPPCPALTSLFHRLTNLLCGGPDSKYFRLWAL